MDIPEEIHHPQSGDEWEDWIGDQLGISPGEGSRMLEEEEFPYSRLTDAFDTAFQERPDLGADFLPSIKRNVRGLVDWTYGDAGEPDWTGSDQGS